MNRPRALTTLILAFLLWLGAFLWLYGGAPPGRAWLVAVLPAAVLVLAAFIRLLKAARDLTLVEAALILAALGLGAGLGAAWLRERQEVAQPDLARIFLDRRADATGRRPRSNVQMRGGTTRSVELFGVVANDNDFPVWEVVLELRFSKGEQSWPTLITFRQDIPARGTAQIAWARKFEVEEIPSQPAWEARVLRARRHWGGGPRRP